MPISEEVQPGNSVNFLREGFSSSIDLLGSCSGKIVVENKFLQLMYAISTLLFLVAEKASRV